MKSIFNKQDAEEFIVRINQLTPTSQQIWGSMTVDKMLAHIQQPIRVAVGEYTPERTLFAKVIGGIAKRTLINEKPFRHNLRTDTSFIIKTERDFEVEKRNAIQLIETLQSKGKEGVAKRKHPIFGKLTPEEWDMLTIKHLDHHLRQFGV